MEKQQRINYNIIDIRLVNFQVSVLSDSQISGLQKKDFAFEMILSADKKFIDKVIPMTLHIKFYSDQMRQLQMGEMTVEGDFGITNYKEIPAETVLNDNVAMAFAVSLIGAARGFYILKNETTFLKGSIIPVVNLETFNRVDIAVKKAK